MSYYLLLIIVPPILVFLYLVYKVLKTRKSNENIVPVFIDEAEDFAQKVMDEVSQTTHDFLESQKDDIAQAQNSLEHAKEILFKAVHALSQWVVFYAKRFFSIMLHFFVIVMKFFRDYTDILYAKSRDFFLYTATKEKETVSLFWHTLKEYKKEADKENKDE